MLNVGKIEQGFVLRSIAFSHIKVDARKIIIGNTADVYAANAKEARYSIRCRRTAVAESTPMHMLLLDDRKSIRPIPPPDIMPASFCNFFTLCILEEENQIHGISIIEHEEPSQN